MAGTPSQYEGLVPLAEHSSAQREKGVLPMTTESDERKAGRKMTQGWSISREISIPDIIAISSALVAAIISFTTLDKRLSLVEDWRLAQHERDLAQDVALRTAVSEIKASIEALRQDLKDRR